MRFFQADGFRVQGSRVGFAQVFRQDYLVAQWYPLPFFGSRFPYKVTNPNKGALVKIWLLGYQDYLKCIKEVAMTDLFDVKDANAKTAQLPARLALNPKP